MEMDIGNSNSDRNNHSNGDARQLMASVSNSDIVASITMVMQSRWQQGHGTVATAGDAK